MSWEEEIPFLLEPNEEIVLKNQNCIYVGQKIVLKTGGWGSNLGVSMNTGWGAISSSIGTFRGKTEKKKEADRHFLSMFVTDRRLVFLKYKTNWRGKETGWDDMFSEIPYEYIPSVKQDKSWGINNVRLNVGMGEDVKRVDLYVDSSKYKEKTLQKEMLTKWENTIFQCCVRARNRVTTISADSQESPLQVLKLRLAKGEITQEEYENLKSILES